MTAFVQPSGLDMPIAEEIVNRPAVVGAYAAREWDEISEDDQEWIAAIVREAMTPVPGSGYVIIDRANLEEARRSMVLLQMEAESNVLPWPGQSLPGWLLDTKASIDTLTEALYPAHRDAAA